MARDIIVNGEALIRVRFGAQLPASISNILSSNTNLSELGLAQNEVRITPNFHHLDIYADDFGPEIPAEIHWMLADANISMTLVHYDNTILDYCLQQSIAGGGNPTNEGTLAPAGTPMGGFVPFLASGYFFVSLNIISPVLGQAWRFPSAYLSENPIVLPLGTKRSLVELNWRAVPFGTHSTGEISSSGVVLWDHIVQI